MQEVERRGLVMNHDKTTDTPTLSASSLPTPHVGSLEDPRLDALGRFLFVFLLYSCMFE